MIYNIFNTFQAANEAQEYDHLFQKSSELATASGVDVSIVRSLNLHSKNEQGEFLLDQYILDNDIQIEFPEIYEQAKKIWKQTSAWAIVYAYNNKYVYRKDHSDKVHQTVEIKDFSQLQPIDGNGNIINLEA